MGDDIGKNAQRVIAVVPVVFVRGGGTGNEGKNAADTRTRTMRFMSGKSSFCGGSG
jgi:hypothetical protein